MTRFARAGKCGCFGDNGLTGPSAIAFSLAIAANASDPKPQEIICKALRRLKTLFIVLLYLLRLCTVLSVLFNSSARR
jgi:hypothetical protein